MGNSGSDKALTLAGLRRDENGIVESVEGRNRDSFRLMEIGLVPGTHVRVLNSGNLRLVAVHGGRFGISRELAETVRIRRAA